MATEVRKKQLAARSSTRINEIAASILLAVSVLVFLSLVSYSSGDWTFNTESSQKTQNWVGLIGAVTADLFFQIIGLTAYVFPAVLALIAWRIFRSVNLHAPLSRVIGFILFVASISGLLSIWVSTGFRGGIVGALVSGGLLY